MDYFEKLEILREIVNLPKNLPTGTFKTEIVEKPLDLFECSPIGNGLKATAFAPPLQNFLGNLNKRRKP